MYKIPRAGAVAITESPAKQGWRRSQERPRRPDSVRSAREMHIKPRETTTVPAVEKRAIIADLGGGVHRVTQPLPWALDHVHCYAVSDSEGWTIFDAGLGTPGTTARWRDAYAALGSPRVRRVVATHYHPDHNGATAALMEVTGADEFVQGRRDHELTYPGFLDPTGPPRFEQHLIAMGMPVDEARSSTVDERDTPYHPADPDVLLDEGDALELQGERFDVFRLPGHAEGHVVFVGATSGRMFGGDTILNEISPNVGLWGEGDSPDPLAEFAHSLERIRDEFEPRIIYPGHRTPIDDAAGRVNELLAHHDARLGECVTGIQGGAATPYELALHLWGSRLDYHQRRFAMVEAAAHLVRLVGLGRAREVTPFRFAVV
jgi:glyoxylase-like metal-dependent hydrolase (beta-lactamase superfamily II)